MNRLVEQKAFAIADEPRKGWKAPPTQDPGQPLDFKPLDQAVAKLQASAAAYQAQASAASGLPTGKRAELNAVLQGAEQALTDERGLPGRPWFRHLAYAPGLLTGYGAKTVPGVREAIESRRWAEAQEYIGRTAAAITAYAAAIDKASALIRS